MGLLEVLFKSAERAVTKAAAQKVNEVVREKSKDILDDLIPTNSKPAQHKSASAQNTSAYDTTPDLPRSFIHVGGWICVKGNTVEEVISALGLKNPTPANWESGILAADKNFLKKCFVARAGDYVVAIGYCPFGVKKTVKEELVLLGNAAAQLEEMTCFATQSVVDLHVWAKYHGTLVRGYGWIGESGEIYLNKGEPTPEEISLGYTDFIQDTNCDWETARFPDMENVHAMAAAWGLAPDLSNLGGYETGTGFVCDIV